MRPDCRPCCEATAAGIGVQFIHRCNDFKKAVQGITFTKSGITFKGSQIDRRFSYAGLEKLIRGSRNGRRSWWRKNSNTAARLLHRSNGGGCSRTGRLRVIVRSREVNMLRLYWFDSAGMLQCTLVALRRRDEPFTCELVTAIKGHLLTVQEQKQLYSEKGLVKVFRKQDGTVYRSQFGIVTKPGQKDMLTETVSAVQKQHVVKADTKPQAEQQQQYEDRPKVKQPENIELHKKKDEQYNYFVLKTISTK